MNRREGSRRIVDGMITGSSGVDIRDEICLQTQRVVLAYEDLEDDAFRYRFCRTNLRKKGRGQG